MKKINFNNKYLKIFGLSFAIVIFISSILIFLFTSWSIKNKIKNHNFSIKSILNDQNNDSENNISSSFQDIEKSQKHESITDFDQWKYFDLNWFEIEKENLLLKTKNNELNKTILKILRGDLDYENNQNFNLGNLFYFFTNLISYSKNDIENYINDDLITEFKENIELNFTKINNYLNKNILTRLFEIELDDESEKFFPLQKFLIENNNIFEINNLLKILISNLFLFKNKEIIEKINKWKKINYENDLFENFDDLKIESIKTYGDLRNGTIKIDYENDYTFQVGENKIISLKKLNVELNIQGDIEDEDYTIDNFGNLNIDSESLEASKAKKEEIKQTSIEKYGDLTNTLFVSFDGEYKFNAIENEANKLNFVDLKTEYNKQSDTPITEDLTILNIGSVTNSLLINIDETSFTKAKENVKQTSIETYGDLKSKLFVSFDGEYKFNVIENEANKLNFVDLKTEYNKQSDTPIAEDLTILNIGSVTNSLLTNIDETSFTKAKAKVKQTSIETYGDLWIKTIKIDYKNNAYTYQIENNEAMSLDQLNQELNNQGDTKNEDYTVEKTFEWFGICKLEIDCFKENDVLTIDLTTLTKAKAKKSKALYGDLRSGPIEVDNDENTFIFKIENKKKLNLVDLNAQLDIQGDTTKEDYTIDNIENSILNIDSNSLTTALIIKKKKINPKLKKILRSILKILQKITSNISFIIEEKKPDIESNSNLIISTKRWGVKPISIPIPFFDDLKFGTLPYFDFKIIFNKEKDLNIFDFLQLFFQISKFIYYKDFLDSKKQNIKSDLITEINRLEFKKILKILKAPKNNVNNKNFFLNVLFEFLYQLDLKTKTFPLENSNSGLIKIDKNIKVSNFLFLFLTDKNNRCFKSFKKKENQICKKISNYDDSSIPWIFNTIKSIKDQLNSFPNLLSQYIQLDEQSFLNYFSIFSFAILDFKKIMKLFDWPSKEESDSNVLYRIISKYLNDILQKNLNLQDTYYLTNFLRDISSLIRVVFENGLEFITPEIQESLIGFLNSNKSKINNFFDLIKVNSWNEREFVFGEDLSNKFIVFPYIHDSEREKNQLLVLHLQEQSQSKKKYSIILNKNEKNEKIKYIFYSQNHHNSKIEKFINTWLIKEKLINENSDYSDGIEKYNKIVNENKDLDDKTLEEINLLIFDADYHKEPIIVQEFITNLNELDEFLIKLKIKKNYLTILERLKITEDNNISFENLKEINTIKKINEYLFFFKSLFKKNKKAEKIYFEYNETLKKFRNSLKYLNEIISESKRFNNQEEIDQKNELNNLKIEEIKSKIENIDYESKYGEDNDEYLFLEEIFDVQNSFIERKDLNDLIKYLNSFNHQKLIIEIEQKIYKQLNDNKNFLINFDEKSLLETPGEETLEEKNIQNNEILFEIKQNKLSLKFKKEIVLLEQFQKKIIKLIVWKKTKNWLEKWKFSKNFENDQKSIDPISIENIDDIFNCDFVDLECNFIKKNEPLVNPEDIFESLKNTLKSFTKSLFSTSYENEKIDDQILQQFLPFEIKIGESISFSWLNKKINEFLPLIKKVYEYPGFGNYIFSNLEKNILKNYWYNWWDDFTNLDDYLLKKNQYQKYWHWLKRYNDKAKYLHDLYEEKNQNLNIFELKILLFSFQDFYNGYYFSNVKKNFEAKKPKALSIETYGDLINEKIKIDYEENDYTFQVDQKQKLNLETLNDQLDIQGDTIEKDYIIDNLPSNIDEIETLAKAQTKKAKVESAQILLNKKINKWLIKKNKLVEKIKDNDNLNSILIDEKNFIILKKEIKELLDTEKYFEDPIFQIFKNDNLQKKIKEKIEFEDHQDLQKIKQILESLKEYGDYRFWNFYNNNIVNNILNNKKPLITWQNALKEVKIQLQALKFTNNNDDFLQDFIYDLEKVDSFETLRKIINKTFDFQSFISASENENISIYINENDQFSMIYGNFLITIPDPDKYLKDTSIDKKERFYFQRFIDKIEFLKQKSQQIEENFDIDQLKKIVEDIKTISWSNNRLEEYKNIFEQRIKQFE